MPFKKSAGLTIEGTSIQYTFTRRDGGSTSVLVVGNPQSARLGDVLSDIFLANLADLDVHNSQVFVELEDGKHLVHLKPHPRLCVDPESVIVESEVF